MLQALRDKTSGWIAVVIVILLAIPFAFFGMEQYLFQNSADYAARVEAPPSWWRSAPDAWPVRKAVWQSEEVSPEAFRSAFEQERQRQRAAQGEDFDARAFESIDNKRRVLDTLVDQAVARLAARNAGIAIGDARVREEIQSVPQFQVDGRFDPQRYQLALQSGVPARSPREFEQVVRENLQQSFLPTRLTGSSFVTPTELERLLRLLGETRDVSIAVLPPRAPDTAAVSGKEIQDWYAANAAEYMAPESVAIEYVEVDGSTLPSPPPADEATLRTRYEQEQSRFVEPAQRLASHLLVRVEDGADGAAQAASEKEANALAARARAPGADFAALAREHSDDEGSSASGGDLGWIEAGTMEGPFEEALFAMAPGEVRGPVKTDFGWHVIQLREVREGSGIPFEEARETLAQEQATSDRERAFNELIGRIVDQVYRNPESLAPAAREAGLAVQKAGPFARGEGSGVAAHPAVQRAAFSEALVEDRTVSDPIELEPTRSVLIRVTDHQPERAIPLAQVRERVIAAIRADRAVKALEQDAEAMAVAVREGQALQAVAAGRGVAVEDLPGVPRGAPAPDPVATEAYFQAPAPAEGKPSAGKVALPDGGYVVFAVTAVTPGDPATASAQDREMLSEQLARIIGNEDANALLRALRQRMNVTVVEARL